jgi:hypothetical protein
VQGHLRGEALSVDIETACGHCDRPLHLSVSSELEVGVEESASRPLLFEPDIAWSEFREPNILNAY